MNKKELIQKMKKENSRIHAAARIIDNKMEKLLILSISAKVEEIIKDIETMKED
jgi:hypothetical protein